MTETNTATQAQPTQLNAEDVAYLQELFNKFNANPKHEGLTPTQQTLLADISESEKTFAEINKQLDTLNTEVNERQKQATGLRDQALHARGKSDALVGALLKLRA